MTEASKSPTTSRAMSLRPIVVGVAVIAAVGALAVTRLVGADRQASVKISAPGRPDLSIPLPAFSLTDQDGRAVTTADLRGEVSIVNFIFTKCPSVCPRLTAKMAVLARETSGTPAIRLVTISVDPENDTPAVLRAYGEKHGADFARWSFLTGDQQALEATVQGGFKVAIGRDDAGAIVHAERFVLVDGDARIRGYYDADDAGQRDLLDAARRLAGAL